VHIEDTVEVYTQESPHDMGGHWEHLIGLTKTALKKVLGRAFVTPAVLQTLIVKIEAVLNDRLLTHVIRSK